MVLHSFTARLPFVGPCRASQRPIRRRLLVAVAGLALLLLTLLPTAAVGAQSIYPPNTVVSTYFDARYGEVSVISDAIGNLIDVNAATGQRIYPVYADYTPGVAYNAPAYTGANYANYYGAPVSGTGDYVVRQYTDTNSNCTYGAVTQTASGYYCTATGAPAYRVG